MEKNDVFEETMEFLDELYENPDLTDEEKVAVIKSLPYIPAEIKKDIIKSFL